jgi:hypothetical protein
LRWVYAALGQFMVEQRPGSRAALPVDVSQPGAGQVVDSGQPQRIASRDKQALVAVDQPDHRDISAVEQPVDVRQRVLTGGGIEQM